MKNTKSIPFFGASLTAVFMLALVSFLPVEGFAQAGKDCSKLDDLITDVYGFKPSLLTAEEKTAKSKEMDTVWNLVKSDKAFYVPCVKAAIDKPGADNFFRFDAANLLFTLDQSDESKRRVARVYGEVALTEVNLEFWMNYISVLGFQGYDTSVAGENWLNTENLRYFLPAHGTKPVDQLVGAYIVFGSMEEKYAVPKLAEIAGNRVHPARGIAFELLAQIQTDEAFKVLAPFVKNPQGEDATLVMNALKRVKQIEPRKGTPKHTREQFIAAFNDLAQGKPDKFTKMVTEASDGEKDAIAVLKKSDVPVIRKARRFFAVMRNPHTPDYYRVFSSIIAAVNKKES